MNPEVLIFLALVVAGGLLLIVFLIKRMIWNRVRSLRVRVRFLENKEKIEKLLTEKGKKATTIKKKSKK